MLPFSLILLVGCLLRLYLTFSHVALPDLVNFAHTAQVTQVTGNPYFNTSYPYGPIWAFVISLLPQPFDVWYKVLLGVVALANALLISRLAPKTQHVLYFMLVWLNPALILSEGWYSQFDSAAVLLLLVAWWLHRTGRPGAWLFGTLALCVKHIVLGPVWMLFVMVYGWRRAIPLMALSLVVFLVQFLPFLPLDQLRSLLNYGGNPALYGFSLLLPHLLAVAMFIGLTAFAPVVGVRQPVPLFVAALVFVVATYGMYSHYLVILLLLAALLPTPRALLVISAGYLVIMLHQFMISDNSMVGLNLIWLACLVWLCFSFRRLLNDQSVIGYGQLIHSHSWRRVTNDG